MSKSDNNSEVVVGVRKWEVFTGRNGKGARHSWTPRKPNHERRNLILDLRCKGLTYLLSLLDSQAATRPVGWISCGLRQGHDRIVDIVFENTDCAKAFVDGVEPAIGPIVAATSMRDQCVTKVRSLAESWAKSVNDQWDDRPDLSFDASERLKAAGEIIAVLQALTLVEGEEKR